MLKQTVIATALVLLPLAVQAQASLLVAGQWEYRDASQMETDEGVSLCLRLDSASTANSTKLRRFDGLLCLRNAVDAARLLGVSQGIAKGGCRYSANGVASVVLVDMKVLPEDEMFDERVEARLAAVEKNQIVSPLTTDCDAASTSAEFKSIYDAIAALKTHPAYEAVTVSDFIRVDASTGWAELDASTQMFLPLGSTDTLVTYYEGNSGLHELSAYRYDGGQWRNVTAEAFPGHQRNDVRFRGTNFYLDGRSGTPKVRTLPDKRAWHYADGRFVPEA